MNVTYDKYYEVSQGHHGIRALTYLSISSSIAPVPHSETSPVPNPPTNVSSSLFVK